MRKKRYKELMWELYGKPKTEQVVSDFLSGNWVCPQCNGKPPVMRFCHTCQFMSTMNGGKISKRDYINNFYE